MEKLIATLLITALLSILLLFAGWAIASFAELRVLTIDIAAWPEALRALYLTVVIFIFVLVSSAVYS